MPTADVGVGVSLETQFIANQIWETIAFIAKAFFMLGLTPWMLRVWGVVGYGEFALGSSAFVLISMFDFGLRGYTRVTLCASSAALRDSGDVICQSALALLVIALAIGGMLTALTVTGCWNQLFRLSPESEGLILVITAFTLPLMLSLILLEGLVARGQIGQVKMANALGWLGASPAVAVILWLHRPVIWAITAWLSCLLVSNYALLLFQWRHTRRSSETRRVITLQRLVQTFRGGFWFSITSITWAAKFHGVTIVIAALSGPTTAGIFFILLRISEVVSAVGAISFDVGLGALARCHSAGERRLCFFTTLRYSIFFSLPFALAVTVLAGPFFAFWLKLPAPLGRTTGIWVAALGLTAAADRLITYAALGLGYGRTAGVCGLAEMLLTLLGIAFLQPILGLVGCVIAITAALVAHFPTIAAILKGISIGAKEEFSFGSARDLPQKVELRISA